MINSARLRHRILIEELRDQVDTDGDVLQDAATGAVTQAWETVDEVWAAIEPLSVREFVAVQATQSKVTVRIVMRHRTDLSAGMRLVHMVNGQRGAVYNPEGFLSDKETGYEYLTIPASSGVSITGQ